MLRYVEVTYLLEPLPLLSYTATLKKEWHAFLLLTIYSIAEESHS